MSGQAAADDHVGSDGRVGRATAVTVALAEFAGLREEITSRSTAQHTLMNLNLTAVGVVGGTVLSQHASPLLLLLLPVVGSALGILFFDHASWIENLGRYIAATIQPIVAAAGGDRRLLSWETDYRRGTRRTSMLLRSGLPLLVMFAAGPITASVFSLSYLDHPWAWWVWSIGLVLEVVLLLLWGHYISKWFTTRSAESKRRPARRNSHRPTPRQQEKPT
jgi:hypothetical protein